ncbi:MAG: aminoglycoside adenylyltransferase domain-containing protein [Pseudomonadales bacterium]
MTRTQAATAYSELNTVLGHLVAGAQEVLQRNFVGAYLQGSFAVGDHSAFSDCDFVIVVEADLAADQLAGLQNLHQYIQRLPCDYWHKNLEGSYAPKQILRRWATEPRDPPGEPRDAHWGDPAMDGAPARCYPFWYLNHGSDTLVRSEHDNSQVVRWTLREHGVRLAGPPPEELIDPVSASALRSEVRATMDLAIDTGLLMSSFALQAFWVGLFCRILHTIETGRITSKKAALQWARAMLDPQWHTLVDQALTLRKGDRAQALALVNPQTQTATRAFAHHCRRQADVRLADRPDD